MRMYQMKQIKGRVILSPANGAERQSTCLLTNIDGFLLSHGLQEP